MFKLNVKTFEQLLIAKQNELVRTFNRAYAGTTQIGNNCIKAQILQSEINTYTGIIEILQASMD